MTLKGSLAAALAAAGAALSAQAGVLYKLTDPAGKVTYVDSGPGGFKGKVQRMDMGGATNAMAPPKTAPAAPPAENPWEKIIRKQPEGPSGRETRIKAARAKLDEAQAALQALVDNSDHADNWIYTGNYRTGFSNRFLKPDYQAKIDRAREQVALAEDDLKTAERELH